MRHVGVGNLTVATHTVAGGHSGNRRLGANVIGIGHGEKQASRCIMTGSTRVMNLVVASAQRHTGGGAGGCRMAAGAFRG